MRTIVQKTLIIACVYIASISFGHAFDLDETVDDEIRKNYNPTQLINDVSIKGSALDKKIQTLPPTEPLPELPSITKQPIKTQVSTTSIPQNFYTGGSIKIKAGTKFDVVNTSTLADWQTKGTVVKFNTQKPIYGKSYTIPSGTIFIGEIVDSHRPQITCNGGLVVVKVNSMIYKGQTIPVNAYIIRANDKKIFFNNIKGDRTYLKTMWKKGNWGRMLFNKMLALTVNLGASGSTLILSPFPFAYGSICLGANTITSPICAFFSKGGSVSIPSGSAFRIKLEEAVFVD